MSRIIVAIILVFPYFVDGQVKGEQKAWKALPRGGPKPRLVYQSGHQREALGVALSRDGQYLASTNRRLIVWIPLPSDRYWILGSTRNLSMMDTDMHWCSVLISALFSIGASSGTGWRDARCLRSPIQLEKGFSPRSFQGMRRSARMANTF